MLPARTVESIDAVVSSFKIGLYRFLDLSVCTGSRVVVKTQDLRRGRGTRTHMRGGRGTEDGGRFPMRPSPACEWVRRERGKAEGDQ